MKDSLARIAPADTATARRLVDASVSDNTRRAYALGRMVASVRRCPNLEGNHG